MKIETVQISSLSPDPANVRKHDQRNLDAIKGSLKRFGQQKPIVVDGKGVIIAGNGTLAAAQSLGWQDIQIVRTDLIGPEATAFAIADNRTAELAAWDENSLAQAIAHLQIEDESLVLSAGFNDADLMELAAMTEQGEAGEQGEAVKMKTANIIKLLIPCDFVSTVERAIDKTGEVNRAEAIQKIFEAYLAD